MQPYLFPYIGYFKLISEVDRLVFFDDVNFINKGWINRNRLLFSGQINYFTVPLSNASQNILICDVAISNDKSWKKKLEASIRQSYSKAQYFDQVYDLISPVLFGEHTKIGDMAKESIVKITNYLSIPTEFINTSRVYENQTLKGECRIRDICRKEMSSEYINLGGGRELYEESNFSADGIKLNFVDPNFTCYKQFATSFAPGLSIIDVLMHNSPFKVSEMLV
jgi:hypothetical protein